MHTRNLIVAALFAASAALGACGGDDESESDEPTTVAEDPRTAPECEPGKKPDPPPQGSTAKMDTSEGAFEIALDTKTSPRTTASFACLADEGFYDGLTFNRIAPDFLIQGGDPVGDRTGGPGYTVIEPPPDDIAYTRGVVAMAKSPAEPHGASGSQFFVVTGADAGLPPQYALLGEVTSGSETIDAIEGLASSSDGPPSEEIVIKRVTVDR